MPTHPARSHVLACSLSLAACEAADSDPVFDADPRADAFRRGSDCSGPDEWTSSVVGDPQLLDEPWFSPFNTAVEVRRDGEGATAFFFREATLGTRELAVGDAAETSFRRTLATGPGVASASNGQLVVSATAYWTDGWAVHMIADFELFEDGESSATARWATRGGMGLPGLAMDRNGNTVVVRTGENTAQDGMAYYLRSLGPDGDWQGPATEHPIDFSVVEYAANVAVGPDGEEVAVAIPNGFDDVRVQRYDAAFNPVGPEIRVDPDLPSIIGQPEIAYLPDGALVVGFAVDVPVNRGVLARVEPDGDVSTVTTQVRHGDLGGPSLAFETVLSMDVSDAGVIAVAGTVDDEEAPAFQLFGPDLEPLTPVTRAAPPGNFYGTAPGVSIADCGPRIVLNWRAMGGGLSPGRYTDITPG